MQKRYYLAISLLLTLTSCTHYYYVPASKNVPLFREKHEYRATFTRANADHMRGHELQAAYSLTNRVAVMANYLYMDGGDRQSENWGRGKYYEGAVGYYKPIRKRGVFEIFAGMGFGKQQHHYGDYGTSFLGGGYSYIGTSNLSLSKQFIQPSIGFTSGLIDIAYTSGLSRVQFHEINNNLDPYTTEYKDLNEISNNRIAYLFENAITLRAGWKYLKLQLQFQTSSHLSKPELMFEKSMGSFGLNFAFADRFKAR